jgi:hypothetical protein
MYSRNQQSRKCLTQKLLNGATRRNKANTDINSSEQQQQQKQARAPPKQQQDDAAHLVLMQSGDQQIMLR